MVTKRLHEPVRPAAGKADRRKPDLPSRLQSRDNIRRTPRGRNCDEDVAGPSQASHLPFECPFETLVIAYRGQNRPVRGECDRRQRIAVKIQP